MVQEQVGSAVVSNFGAARRAVGRRSRPSIPDHFFD